MTNLEKYMFTNQEDFEKAALQLNTLLIVLSATDTDNAAALAEMPHALQIAADIAGKIYTTVVEVARVEEK